MKLILKEWSKNKNACGSLLVHLVSRILYLIINARIVISLATTLEDYQNISDHLPEIIILFAGLIVMGGIKALSSLFNHKIYTSMNESMLNKILDADYDMFTNVSCSTLSSTYSDLWCISDVGKTLVDTFLNGTNIVINVTSIYLLYPSMTLPIILVYGTLLLLCQILFVIYGKFDEKSDLIKRSRNQEFHELIDSFAEVRGFNTQNHHFDSITDQNKKILGIYRSRAFIDCGIEVTIEGLCALGTIITVLMIVKDMGSGVMSQAIAMSLIMYVWRLTNPILMILNNLGDLSEHSVIFKRYNEVMSYQNEPNEEFTNLNSFNDSIEIKDLSFQYNDSDMVLENINMRIKKGQKIGICGSSGSGKTTLIKLLEKFYNPTGGSIEIDGIDSRLITASSIRKKMGIVHQDPYIFSTTIYENIRYGNWECSGSDVIEACKKANLYNFIQSLPEKFHTKVGSKGLKLSGGQKQRIALARIFLSNPEIVLLDEATSALDNESEVIIQEALSMFRDKTLITIAHRLSTIKDSDNIYVIENHTIEESGSHDELMQKKGRYYNLVKISEKEN